MSRRWLVVTPALLLLGAGGWKLLDPIRARGDGRIADARLRELEVSAQRHLYAPTWLPRGGQVGMRGTLQGARRVLQDFTDREGGVLCILAQEPRGSERDTYNKRIFITAADARAEVNGVNAYFVTGAMGERRLFWQVDSTALILSGYALSDQELLRIARSTR
jgi:hypothetical protein